MPVAFRRIRSRTAPLAKTAAMRLGAYAAVRSLLPSRRIAILRYHAICGTEGHAYADPAICTSPAAFENHVRYLAANYSVLPLTEIVTRLRSARPLPPNSVALTFDDGYADNFEAARILHRYRLSGTFYITAGCMAGGEPFWPAEIRGLIRAVRDHVVRLSTYRGVTEIPLRSEFERQAAIKTISRLFKAHPILVRERLRDQLRAAAGSTRLECYMLQWGQIAEMVRLGMTIGAHTLTHPNLPSAGAADAVAEVSGSKRRLEDAIGRPVRLFSYPNGGAERYYTSELQRLVQRAGFAAAATSRNGFAGPDSDLYALERIQVHERLEDLLFALEVERFAFASGR
jgi:peptidoglycan/xylan/chitin deacetylase (PgdA/CDA1 family)